MKKVFPAVSCLVACAILPFAASAQVASPPAAGMRELSPWSMFMSADILVKAVMISLAFASLVYVTIWIPILTGLPLTAPGAALPGPGQWLQQVGQSLSTLFSDQPLIHVLISAVVIGYVTAVIPGLRAVARGLIMRGQDTLWLFRKLLWYYPVMIGALAIGIPLKFGLKGMTAYGQTTLWVGLATVSWSNNDAIAR